MTRVKTGIAPSAGLQLVDIQLRMLLCKSFGSGVLLGVGMCMETESLALVLEAPARRASRSCKPCMRLQAPAMRRNACDERPS
jgi:hypothetical protein